MTPEELRRIRAELPLGEEWSNETMRRVLTELDRVTAWKESATQVLGEHHETLQKHGRLGESLAQMVDRVTAERDEATQKFQAKWDECFHVLGLRTEMESERDTALARAKKAEADAAAFGDPWDRASVRTVVGQLDTALAEAKRLREALTRLLDRMDYVHEDPAYQGVWTVALIHVGPYQGPQYGEEFQAARAALAPHPAPEAQEDVEQCPSHSAGLQCCNVEGHAGDHQWRGGPPDNLRRVTWPPELKR